MKDNLEKSFTKYGGEASTRTFKNQKININHTSTIMDNILRLFDTLPNFLFTTSETKRDY